MAQNFIYLASQSPRRRQLLEQLGVAHELLLPGPEEDAESLEGVDVIHAGTALDDGTLVTAGGRVLAVTAVGDDVADARSRAYDGVGRISFAGAQHRTDIAAGI